MKQQPKKIKNTSSSTILSLLLKEGILTQEKTDHVLRIKSKLPSKNLCDILKDLKYITPVQLKDVLRTNHLSLRIGEILVEFGYLSPEKLDVALDIQQKEKHKRLGEVIIEQQFLTERAFLEALSVQLGFPYINLSTDDLDLDMIRTVPLKWCQINRFIPVYKKEEETVVAFADPFNKAAIDAARKLLGDRILIAISSAAQIDAYLENLTGKANIPRSIIDENTATGMVNRIIGDAIDKGTSDIHLEPLRGCIHVRYRIDGILIFQKEIAAEATAMVTSRIKIMAKADISEKRRHQDGRMVFEHKGNRHDLRVSFYASLFGEKIVMRILNRMDQIIPIEEIGMQPKMLKRYIQDVLNVPSGVLVITGPTGSGKTTTLYSSITHVNKPEISIITAEDPVEYTLEGITQCSINPAINLTYKETLRHIVRQDPDIIVIGEIRDNYSADVAVHAALSGHKVLTSFHTEDSIGGLVRLMNMEVEAFLISSTVVCILSQRLLRKVCTQCKEITRPLPGELKLLGYVPKDISRYKFMKGKGCPACGYTGYKGRLAVFEMLVLNESVREAILNHKSSYEIRKISIETTEMVTLMEDALIKVSAGVTTLEELFRCVPRLMPPRQIHEIKRLLGA